MAPMAARGRKSGGGDGSKSKPQPKSDKAEMKGAAKVVEKGSTKGAAKGPLEKPPAKRKGAAAADLAASPLTSPSSVGVAQLDLESPVPSPAASEASNAPHGGETMGSHNDNG